MSERSELTNGRFLHNLDGWAAASALYAPGDGDDHYGVASIGVGGYVEQDFAVSRARSYTLHLSVKPVGAPLSAGQATARIVDGSGATVTTIDLSGAADTWTEQEFSIGLAPGTTYTLRLANVSAAGAVKIDDVWLWWVPKTRAQLAAIVAAKISRVASDRGYSTTPSGSLSEGDYSYAVDAGLRSVGAIDEETDLPDVRWLDAALLDTALDAIEREMLQKAQREYMLEVDVGTEQRRESLSQIAKALAGSAGAAGSVAPRGGNSGGRVVMRSLRHRASDYELGDE